MNSSAINSVYSEKKLEKIVDFMSQSPETKASENSTMLISSAQEGRVLLAEARKSFYLIPPLWAIVFVIQKSMIVTVVITISFFTVGLNSSSKLVNVNHLIQHK